MLAQALLCFLDSLATFLTLVLLLRFLMQAFRVSFANPVGNLVLAASNWLVLPLRRVLPGVFGLDMASLLPAYLLQAALLTAVIALGGVLYSGTPAMLIGVVLAQALRAMLRLGVYLMIGALILQAVLSWINPRSPISLPLGQLTRPLLGPIRRFLPPLGTVDLSPLVAILFLQLLLIFL